MTGTWDLVWGIKPSFLTYVRSVPDLRITLEDGVQAVGGGDAWRFPTVAESLAGDPFDGGSGRLDFGGTFRLNAYGDAMELTLIQPRVEVAGGTATLSVGSPGAPSVRLMLATAATASARRGDDGSVELDLALHPAGVGMFNGIYPPGTALAPLLLQPRA